MGLPPWVYDLSHSAHKKRQIIENYEFLIETGASHEEAVDRLGVAGREWVLQPD